MDSSFTIEDPFQSLDEAERGVSYTVMTDECYLPAHKSRGWIRCFIYTSGTSYRLYLENRKRFLLSAVQVDEDNFLISTHEDFPLAKRGESGYGASVSRQKDKSFLVTLNTCHYCDNKLGKMTCGRGVYNREVVAKVRHKVRRFKVTNADMRCIIVSFPYLGSVPRKIHERNIWCPRSIRNAVPFLPIDADTIKGVEVHPNRVACINKLPDWNPEVESLVLRFQGNRVLSSSSKNFLLYEERKLRAAADEASTTKGRLASEGIDDRDSDIASNSGTGTSVGSATDDMRSVYSGASYDNDGQPSDLATTAISADHAILQFGKVSDNRFIMDFKYPLSPLQSFGICLCSFAPDAIKATPRPKDATNHRPQFARDVKDLYGRMRGTESDEESVSSISSFNSFGSGNTGERGRGPPRAPGSQPSSPAAFPSQKQQFVRRTRTKKRPSYSAEFRNARASLDVEEGDSEEDV